MTVQGFYKKIDLEINMKDQEMLIVVREPLSFYPIMPWLISITHMIQAYHHVLELYCLSAQVSKALAEDTGFG